MSQCKKEVTAEMVLKNFVDVCELHQAFADYLVGSDFAILCGHDEAEQAVQRDYFADSVIG